MHPSNLSPGAVGATTGAVGTSAEAASRVAVPRPQVGKAMCDLPSRPKRRGGPRAARSGRSAGVRSGRCSARTGITKCCLRLFLVLRSSPSHAMGGWFGGRTADPPRPRRQQGNHHASEASTEPRRRGGCGAEQARVGAMQPGGCGGWPPWVCICSGSYQPKNASACGSPRSGGGGCHADALTQHRQPRVSWSHATLPASAGGDRSARDFSRPPDHDQREAVVAGLSRRPPRRSARRTARQHRSAP